MSHPYRTPQQPYRSTPTEVQRISLEIRRSLLLFSELCEQSHRDFMKAARKFWLDVGRK